MSEGSGPGLGELGALADLSEVYHAVHTIGHAAGNFAPWLQPTLGTVGNQAAMLQNGASAGGVGLSNVLAPLALASGINNMMHADSSANGIVHGAEGALQTVAGGIGTVGLAGSGLTGLGGVTGIGALGTAGGAATGFAAAAAPVAAVAGAGALGLYAGNTIANWTEGHSAGNFGVDEWGHTRTASDAAADSGISAENSFQRLVGAREGSGSVGDIAGGILGGAVAGGMGIVNTGVNAAMNVGHGVSSLWDSGTNAVGGWFGGLERAITPGYANQ